MAHQPELVDVFDNEGKPVGRLSVATAAVLLACDPEALAGTLVSYGRVRTPEFQVLPAADVGPVS